MKLVKYGASGSELPAIIIEDEIYDLSSIVKGDFYGLETINAIEEADLTNLKKVDSTARIGSPLSNVSKIICIGLNYRKHAEESGMDLPSEPVIFFKSTTAICGPFDPVMLPKNGDKTDWEVELGVVIGKKASYVDENEAMDYVSGYVLHNDISERSFQLERGGQWVKGKSCDTFAPLGPYLVTKDEIEDPNNLNIWLKLNGQQIQSSNTNDMVFNVKQVVSYLSQFMTLLPGDVISTGTPAGVGFGMRPPKYLKAGDVMELGIEGLGISRQEVVSFQKE